MKIFRYQRPKNLLEAFFSFTPYSTKKEWGKKEFVIKVEANPDEYLASLYCEDVIIAQLLYNIPNERYYISLLMTSLEEKYSHRRVENDSIFRTLKSLVRGLREYLGVKIDIDLTTAYIDEDEVIPLLKIGDTLYRSYFKPYSKYYTYKYEYESYFIFNFFRLNYDSFSFSHTVNEMFNIFNIRDFSVLSSKIHLETDEGKSVSFYTDALPYIMFSSDKEIEEAYKELDKQIEEISRLWYEFHRKDAKKSEEIFKKLREFISSHFEKIFTPDIFFRDYYGVWLNYLKRDVLLRKVNFASKIIENVIIPEIKKELIITEILSA